jgi:2-desacetyl-2-hydroxyethyl bacteriochlorophyllide A dehydrogenase
LNRELWFVAPRQVEVRATESHRNICRHEVRVRGNVSGVSQGTELLLYRGEGPTPFDSSLGGDPNEPTYPRRYGYAWVGTIEEAGADVVLPVGARVFCLASHGDVHLLHADAVRPLPEAVTNLRAVLAANLETAITAAWDSGIGLGDRVVVVGGGVVGLLCAWVARHAGAREVHVIEPSARRRAIASALGATSTAPPRTDADADARDAHGRDADVVLEASGRPECLDTAIAHAAVEGTVAVVSFYGARLSPVGLGDAFHRRRLRLVATQVSTVPSSRAPRWTKARRFDLVAQLLADPMLDMLLDVPVPFDDAPATYARLARSPSDSLQVCFDYRAPS